MEHQTKALKNKKTNKSLTWVGIYEIIGGSIGIFLFIMMLFKIPVFEFTTVLLLFIILLLFSNSIFAGVQLLRNRKLGINLSLINQSLQLLFFTASGFTYEYISGLGIYLIWGYDNSFIPFLNYGISNCQLHFDSQNNSSILGINVVAIFIFIFLCAKKRQVKASNQLSEISTIGKTYRS